MTDYEKAVHIVKNKDYTKDNKKFLFDFAMLNYPCSIVLDDINVTISVNLKNQLVIEPMDFYDSISNL